ncbi:FKBP-type peptidyl-prolyl cis-trans isomerase [Algoriphagus pacificus]|uniref:Peptidyl-prolyl cis-trans isomerase n=1 Tax=Algoriphagus pacificus TaxID=2811234 RepID=A0ABS3CBK5_9BACT|nr:FKBP-type peptidyl-prolyl cis-trans isomerase [Algoriphagus pacificus]MBN7814491.1 FKBP-type peptidyl-prolyl cis-trans isomerase [Algoriphagus pacificus]
MKYLFNFLLIGVFAAMIACEPNNPFDTGPVYDVDGNLAIDSVKIAAYLDTAQIDSIYRIHDPSGVVIIVQEEGEGSRPTGGNIVRTDYTGLLMSDGSIFDTNNEIIARQNDLYVEGRTYNLFSFVVGAGNVITGWDIAYRRMRPGTKARLIIPSPYGYRDSESNSRIPANSVLMFDVNFRGID